MGKSNGGIAFAVAQNSFISYALMKGYLLVFLQFTFILFVLIGGPISNLHSVFLFIQLPSLYLGIWSVLIMTPKRFNVHPAPSVKTRLLTKGPYRYIRHPMYLSVCLFCLGSLLNHGSVGRIISYFSLVIVLVIKILYEEKLLNKSISTYALYQQKTWRLFPGIW
jgi:protein-S-isoprenylcysteine O-methyltransferase Ste14